MSIKTLRSRQKCNFKVNLMSYDKKILPVLKELTRCEKETKCSASLAFYTFLPARLINSTKHEHSIKIKFSIKILHSFSDCIRGREHRQCTRAETSDGQTCKIWGNYTGKDVHVSL